MELIENNHNIMNYRYYIIGGSCDAIMGSYVFSPYLLNMYGVSNGLWRIQDYVSDLLVINPASAMTTTKLSNLECNDNGNISATCAYLLFMNASIYGVSKNMSDMKKYLCTNVIQCYSSRNLTNMILKYGPKK